MKLIRNRLCPWRARRSRKEENSCCSSSNGGGSRHGIRRRGLPPPPPQAHWMRHLRSSPAPVGPRWHAGCQACRLGLASGLPTLAFAHQRLTQQAGVRQPSTAGEDMKNSFDRPDPKPQGEPIRNRRACRSGRSCRTGARRAAAAPLITPLVISPDGPPGSGPGGSGRIEGWRWSAMHHVTVRHIYISAGERSALVPEETVIRDWR